MKTKIPAAKGGMNSNPLKKGNVKAKIKKIDQSIISLRI
jgi:hypothetical protein